MAIIYTYPSITEIEGVDLFLISDMDDEKATRTISAQTFGQWISDTFGEGKSLYSVDDSLASNRLLKGAGNTLQLGADYIDTVVDLESFTIKVGEKTTATSPYVWIDAVYPTTTTKLNDNIGNKNYE